LNDIFILPSDDRVAATLTRALEPPHRVHSATSFRELDALLRRREPQACVLDVFDPPPPVPLNALRRLRTRHPAMALVIASDFAGREMELYHLGRMSIDGVIRMENGPSTRGILSVVDRAVVAALGTQVVLISAFDRSPAFQEAVRWAIEHAEEQPQVSQMATALGMTPRALALETRAQGLRSPRDLLLWGRLIRATQLLERSTETVESAAFHLGYSTGGALGKALKGHMGCSPTVLLENGGLEWALGVFRLRMLEGEKVQRRNRTGGRS